tara:strand:- start:6649 stop:7092 length:444 start_codon:yes stop_codon:yes gene_type:complete
MSTKNQVFLTRRADGSFLPSTDEDKEKLNRIKLGETIAVNYRKPRNAGNHRRFFVMINLFAENLPEGLPIRYENPDYLRYEALIATGFCEWRESRGGLAYPVPNSMAFDKMDEDSFQKVYGAIVNYLLKHFSDFSESDFNEHINLLT